MNRIFSQRRGQWFAVLAEYHERALHTDTGYTYRRLFTPQIVEIGVNAGNPFKTFAAFQAWCTQTSSAYAHTARVLAKGAEGDRNGLMTPGEPQVAWMKRALKRWRVANLGVINGGCCMEVSALPVMVIGGVA